MNRHLLIIDPQNDFCDLPPGVAGTPALPVPGAHADMQRLARRIGEDITAITVTLDSHHHVDIAHPTFWTDVAPFTQITAAQVRAGQFKPRDASALPRVLAYLDALEAAGRYTLMVWPVHCEIGSWGHNVHADVRAACNAWEERTQGQVEFVTKGANPWTEHYSAVEAEVPDPADPATSTNAALIARLATADEILVAGEASSHCVKATVEHLVQHLPPARFVLLADCMSPVAGFEAQAQSFLDAMAARGARVVAA